MQSLTPENAGGQGRVVASDAESDTLTEFMTKGAIRLRKLSVKAWGEGSALEFVGRSGAVEDLLAKAEKVARYREPVLITGESGAGKELVARALYLFGGRKGEPYVEVNCPQYREGNLTASELFGHRKGSFTGAVADRKGAWEAADGGMIFLDEIADLHVDVQAMLLRTLSSGEYKPLGADRNRSANVRVMAATNRPLNKMMLENAFRRDLFFRLRRFHLALPPLRERGEDWRLILEHSLKGLCRKYAVAKRFSTSALQLLRDYPWPGNARQVVSVATMGYAMADGRVVEPGDFAAQLDEEDPGEPDAERELFDQVMGTDVDFWEVVYQPFMNRDLNRSQVRDLIRRGLAEAKGNYRQLLKLLRLAEGEYQRFMDFLRHHDLKP